LNHQSINFESCNNFLTRMIPFRASKSFWIPDWAESIPKNTLRYLTTYLADLLNRTKYLGYLKKISLGVHSPCGKVLKALKRGGKYFLKISSNYPLCGVALSHTQIWVICLWAKVHKSVEFVHCVRATSGVSQRAIAP
jgi:hypothetical protein